MSNLHAALGYAQRGWPVFPVKPGAKAPLVEHGVKDATRDEATIRTWWSWWPDAGIGVALGKPSGLVAVDQDRHRNAPDGFEHMRELERQHGKLPDTVTSLTGGGGQHRFFLYRPGLRTRSLAPGVELRSDGAYVILPPSLHPSGEAYMWEASGHVDDVSVAEAPDWFGEADARGNGHEPAPPVGEKIPEGQRNATLASIAGTMRRRGLGEDEIAAALVVVNDTRCTPPLPEDEVRAIAASVARYEPARPLVSAPAAQDEEPSPPWHDDERQAVPTRQRQTVWTAQQLLEADFPEPQWIVPDLLPVGLAALAGRPKTGKSWWMLQLAVSVSVGGMVFDRRVKQGPVLFLALEDSPRRLKSRLALQNAPANIPITFHTDWPLLSRGGLPQLQKEIEQGGYRLICIDTFSRLVGNVDQDSIGLMTVVMGSLQEIAEAGERCILLNDHHRKPTMLGADPIDDILGSTGKAAVVDTAIGLYRNRGKRETTLKIIGRDVEEQELALAFDKLTGCWQCLGEAGAVRHDSEKGQVLRAVKELIAAGELATATRISSHTRIDRSNVTKALAELVHLGEVTVGEKVGREQPYRLY